MSDNDLQKPYYEDLLFHIARWKVTTPERLKSDSGLLNCDSWFRKVIAGLERNKLIDARYGVRPGNPKNRIIRLLPKAKSLYESLPLRTANDDEILHDYFVSELGYQFEKCLTVEQVFVEGFDHRRSRYVYEQTEFLPDLLIKLKSPLINNSKSGHIVLLELEINRKTQKRRVDKFSKLLSVDGVGCIVFLFSRPGDLNNYYSDFRDYITQTKIIDRPYLLFGCIDLSRPLQLSNIRLSGDLDISCAELFNFQSIEGVK